MKNIVYYALFLLPVAMMATGCGGREAHPVAVTNLNDSGLDCAAIEREIMANNQNIRTTLKEKSNGQLKNAALGVGGLIIWPAWFFMDPKSPEKVEITAYQNRNNVLKNLANQKKCKIAAQQT